MKAAKAAMEIELDLGRYELRRQGRRVKLEKKPMELLIFLVSRRNQMVARDEIVKKLWRSDLFIDAEPNVNNVVRKIRTALGDNPERPRFLETVVGKGYRFIGPIQVIEAHYPAFQSGNDSSVALPVERAQSSEARRERSSLAVIPLLILGKEKDDHGLSLGFADALVARLGTLENLDVLPISTVLNLPPDRQSAEIAANLGVRFVLRGGIQMSKGEWRLSLEMFDSQLQAVCLSRKCDLDRNRLPELEADIARQVATALNRPLRPAAAQPTARFSRDPLAYAEFMRGYRLSASPNAAAIEQATNHLTNAIARDPAFALAHATLSVVCATRHFEFDPASVWLEKAEFHCSRALELDSRLPEGHVARAFIQWGPSKNFQHLEAIADLKRALTLQPNLPHAYNRLGTILAHIGLLEQAKAMYERGRPFQPHKEVSFSIVQAYIWNIEYEKAGATIEAWQAASPDNKYVRYFAPYLAMMTGNSTEAGALLEKALHVYGEDPMIVSLQGVLYAMTGNEPAALDCMARACTSPKSFGHAHHTYYQIACILSLLGRKATAFEWLERSVSTGFACWPFFLKDTCLNLRGLADFELLVSSLQARYPEYLGML